MSPSFTTCPQALTPNVCIFQQVYMTRLTTTLQLAVSVAESLVSSRFHCWKPPQPGTNGGGGWGFQSPTKSFWWNIRTMNHLGTNLINIIYIYVYKYWYMYIYIYILHNCNYIICYEWNRTWHLGPVPRKHLSQDQPLKEKKEATTFIIVCTWIMPPSHSSNISFPLHKRVYRFIDPSKAEPGWKVDVWKTILSFEAFAFQLPREFFSWFSCLQRSWESHMVSSTGLAHISRLRRAAISLNSVDSINTSHMNFMDFSWIMYPQQAG